MEVQNPQIGRHPKTPEKGKKDITYRKSENQSRTILNI